jgi:hypothetical protein
MPLERPFENLHVAGPGAVDGIAKCFADAGGLPAAEVIAWIADTSHDHFTRLELEFPDLWGHWPTLIDWQNVFCEVSKHTRATHPHVHGTSGRTRIKPEFRQTPARIDYRFPAKWGLPPERTVHVKGQQPHVEGTPLVPAAFTRVAEHRPRNRLIGHRRTPAILDVVHSRVRTALKPGQTAEDGRPAQTGSVR